MKRETVYLRRPSSAEGTCLCQEGRNNTLSFIAPLIEEEAYVLTEEELRRLLDEAWRGGEDLITYYEMGGTKPIEKDEYINSVLK